jgi:hypothetical protein
VTLLQEREREREREKEREREREGEREGRREREKERERLFRIAMMHTKLIRMKWGMFWNILNVAEIDQGQVRGPGVLHQVHEVVQDGQSDQDEMGNVQEYTTGCWS